MRKLILAVTIFSLNNFAVSKETKEMKVERVNKSLAYYEEMTKVILHPRCLNCHPAGNAPTQGMDLHVHQMNVQRGPFDDGNTGLRCATCHQDENNDSSGVPGAPRWKLAPKELAWQGKTKGEICRQLKDPKKTHMTLEELITHNGQDEIVAWGWNPGKGRESVPGTQKQFGELTAQWVATGAECPK
jgi:hypothetical protein